MDIQENIFKNTNTDTNTVYVVKENNQTSEGELVKIGNIRHLSTDNKKQVNVEKRGIESVYNFNKEICNFIAENGNESNFGGKYVNLFHYIECSDICGLVFSKMMWRRCTGYLVIQTSSKGVRYLCYLYDEINHNGQSFGTGCELAAKNVKYIKEHFRKCIPELNSLVNISQIVNKNSKSILRLDNNLDKDFGL